jgi:hypothetical protein
MPRFYDPNQPRVPKGHDGAGEWTDGAHVQQAFLAPPVAAGAAYVGRIVGSAAFVGATALYTWLSRRNNPDERAIIAVKAQEYVRDGKEPVEVGSLTRDEVRDVCKRLEKVQDYTNAAAAEGWIQFASTYSRSAIKPSACMISKPAEAD